MCLSFVFVELCICDKESVAETNKNVYIQKKENGTKEKSWVSDQKENRLRQDIQNIRSSDGTYWWCNQCCYNGQYCHTCTPKNIEMYFWPCNILFSQITVHFWQFFLHCWWWIWHKTNIKRMCPPQEKKLNPDMKVLHIKLIIKTLLSTKLHFCD